MNHFKKAALLLMLALFGVSIGFQTQAFAEQCALCTKADCKDNCPCHGTENCGACKGAKG